MTSSSGDELLARLAATRTHREPEPVPEWDADLIPEVDDSGWEPTQIDKQIDAILEDVDILDAYRLWGGKGFTPKVGNRNENIMVRCPNPSHVDEHPSAWINAEKGVYCCGSCGNEGGDKYTLAAYYFGYSVPGYQRTDFPKLRRDMVTSLGYPIHSVSGEEYIEIHEPEPAPVVEPVMVAEAPVAPPVAPPAAPPAVHAAEQPPADDVDEDLEYKQMIARDLRIDWETMVPPDTFLYEWMEAVTIDDLPHEYYFWLGLQALGFAVGNNRLMADARPVKPNLFICLYGRTGVGKSRAIQPYIKLLESAMPFDNDVYGPCHGVMVLPSPGSAEALIDSFKHDILDTENKVVGSSPVKGLLKVEEFAGFTARAARVGSTLKETLIELYDVIDGNVTHHTRGTGVTLARSPFTQMITTTQPKAIGAFLNRTDTESGFLNRWVFVAGQGRVAPIPYGGVEPDIDNAIHYLKAIVRWSDTRKYMVLQGLALDAWTAFFNRELARFKSGEQHQESMMSRIDLTLKKVIVLLTANAKLEEPTADIVEKAVSLYPYLLRTYGAVGMDIAMDEQGECQAWIISRIRKFQDENGHGPSTRDLAKYVNKKFTLEIMRRTLDTMESLGVIEKVSTSGGRGRPTVRYQYL